MINATLKVFAVSSVLFLSACSTHMIPLKYDASDEIEVSNNAPLVSSTSVSDARKTDSNWLGAIRGGYGNPLKKLRTDKPTDEAVNDVLVSALKARNMLGTAETSNKILDVSIEKFDCSYYFNREAHAHLLVMVYTTPGRTPIFSHKYKTDNVEPGVGAGIFGDVNHLAQFAQKTLNETIDKALNDPKLLSALTQ